MRRTERLNAILEQVTETGRVDVLDLAAEFGVSGATVRRDLQALSRGQLLIRTHGGATTTEAHNEVPTQVKAGLRRSEKVRVGHAAADLVPDGAVVGLTGGTTTLEVARALADRRGITIVTNAINVAGELAGRSGLRLSVIGGIIRNSLELVGPAAEAMLSNYNFDLAFIGVDGITPEHGCTTYDEMEAQTDLGFLRRAQRRVVVADSSKIGRVTFARIADLTSISDVVTDSAADQEQLDALRAAGPNVVVV